MRIFNENAIKIYNPFCPLLDHVECFLFNNFGHKAYDFRASILRPPNQSREEDIIRYRNQRIKVWRRKFILE